MRSSIQRLIAFGLIVPCFLDILICSVHAANPLLNLPSKELGNTAPMIVFAQVPLNATGLSIIVENANLIIKHSIKDAEIVVSSNCPSHWSLKGQNVRQVGFSPTRTGVSIRADRNGAVALLNGKVYQLPDQTNGVVRNLKIENGKVLVNGQELTPLGGSRQSGNCTGVDSVEITVPGSYKGDLSITTYGSSSSIIDSWQGGDLTIQVNGNSKLSAGKLANLGKAILGVQGQGKLEVKSVIAKALVADIDGSGSISLEGGGAEMSNATISGAGHLILKGKFRNLKKSVSGTGEIELLP